MSYQSGQSRYYRFPGYDSILNYEKDHHIYCPPADIYYSIDSFSFTDHTTYWESEATPKERLSHL